MPTKDVQVPISTEYQIVNETRMVVFSGRDQFALNDSKLAVPFGLLKYLVGSLTSAEGQAELQRAGITLQEPAPALHGPPARAGGQPT